MSARTEHTLNQCQSLFEAGDIKGADALIRPLARHSRYGKHHDRICELEEQIVDAIIEENKVVDLLTHNPMHKGRFH